MSLVNLVNNKLVGINLNEKLFPTTLLLTKYIHQENVKSMNTFDGQEFDFKKKTIDILVSYIIRNVVRCLQYILGFCLSSFLVTRRILFLFTDRKSSRTRASVITRLYGTSKQYTSFFKSHHK